MTLSRKEFFRQGLFSLGETLLKAAGLKQQPVVTSDEELADRLNSATPLLAVPRNEYCLARNCGCFICVDRCEAQAITMRMGVGISIDATLCTGCGSCLYVCPVTPKAIRMTAQ